MSILTINFGSLSYLFVNIFYCQNCGNQLDRFIKLKINCFLIDIGQKKIQHLSPRLFFEDKM